MVFPFRVSLAFCGCSSLLWNFPYMGKFIWEYMLKGRRDSWPEPHFVRSVPSSPLLSRIIWFIIMLKNTEPQNLSSFSSVNFVITSFQDFTLYVNIKAPNKAFQSRQQTFFWTISSTKLKMRILKGVALMSTFPHRFWTWTCETQSLHIFYGERQRKKYGRKAWSFLQQL